MAATLAPLGLGTGLSRSKPVSRSSLGAQLRAGAFQKLASAPISAFRRPNSAVSLRVVAAAADKHSYVGKTDFSTSKGKMGLISFGAEPGKKSSKSKLFVALFVALGLPIIAAAAVVHNVPAAPAIAGPTAAALKGTYAITMAAVLLMYWASINVSLGRGKYKVRPPATTGVSDDFDRIFRVQANTIEQVIQFLPALWVFSLFVSPAISTAAGAVWVLGRVLYAKGYYEKAAARGAGFGIASLASNFLIAGATFGVIKSIIA